MQWEERSKFLIKVARLKPKHGNNRSTVPEAFKVQNHFEFMLHQRMKKFVMRVMFLELSEIPL